jgi:hypothetical protein
MPTLNSHKNKGQGFKSVFNLGWISYMRSLEMGMMAAMSN